MEEDPDNASGSAAEDAQEPVSITQEPVSISIVEEPATAVDDGDDSTTSSSNSPEQAMAGLRDVVENDHRQRSSALARSTTAAAPGVVSADAPDHDAGSAQKVERGDSSSTGGEVLVEAEVNDGGSAGDASLGQSSGVTEAGDSAVGVLVPASLRTTNTALERCQAKLEASRARELRATQELDAIKSQLAEVTEELEAMRAEARGAKQASSEDRSGGGGDGGGGGVGIARSGSHGGGDGDGDGGGGETKLEVESKGDSSDDDQLRRLLAIREVQLKVGFSFTMASDMDSHMASTFDHRAGSALSRLHARVSRAFRRGLDPPPPVPRSEPCLR